VDDDDWGSALEGGHHHMGTTRMASDAGRGVVDPECRLFNIENLYLAGSSVFPVSGTATPTLAIIQLALRLADRLKADLSG
jgi:choline dehydrogenase-like flavoprotein